MRKRFMSAAGGRAAIALTAVFGCFCGTQSVLAQGGVTIDVGDCVKLTSPGERFDCYERQVNAADAKKAATPPAASSAPSPVPMAAAGAAAVAPAAVSPTAVPSAPATAKPETQSSSSGKSERDVPPDIVATISELRETVPNSWLITLDNGQVWRQSYPETYFLRPGMRVTLRGSKWGTAYRLTADGLNGFIQVLRVK